MMELRASQGTQFLWNGDEKYWRDCAPVLFPYENTWSIAITEE